MALPHYVVVFDTENGCADVESNVRMMTACAISSKSSWVRGLPFAGKIGSHLVASELPARAFTVYYLILCQNSSSSGTVGFNISALPASPRCSHS